MNTGGCSHARAIYAAAVLQRGAAQIALHIAYDIDYPKGSRRRRASHEYSYATRNMYSLAPALREWATWSVACALRPATVWLWAWRWCLINEASTGGPVVRLHHLAVVRSGACRTPWGCAITGHGGGAVFPPRWRERARVCAQEGGAVTYWPEFEGELAEAVAETMALADASVEGSEPIEIPAARPRRPARLVPTEADVIEGVKARMDSPRERTHMVGTRVNPLELDQWKRAAKRDGRAQLGRWVREVVDDYVKGSQRAGAAPRAGGKAAHIGALLEVADQLSRIGNNLNQITKRVNVDDAIYGEDIEEITALKSRLDDVLHAAMAEVGGA